MCGGIKNEQLPVRKNADNREEKLKTRTLSHEESRSGTEISKVNICIWNGSPVERSTVWRKDGE